MPVKVRCQSCEKVFNAPDAARGKTMKCPGCEGKVKVPAGDGAKSGGASKPAAKKPAAKVDEHHDEHEHFLKNMDLDSVADDGANICPKCGQEIYDEETTECPACGLNFETGQTKEKQKGIDPKGFFRVVWKDSWKFLKDNRPFAIRTSIYTVVFSLLHLCCLFMVSWCASFPPRVFWGGLTIFTFMVPAGWVWFLNGEIIKMAMEKREKMGRINFDMYTCVALGLKFIFWNIAMGVQTILPLVGAFLIKQENLVAGAALIGVGELVILLLIPQVMVHMTMPITRRGWMAHIQFQTLGKTFGACALWAVIAISSLLPVLAPLGILGGIKHGAVAEFAGTFVYNFKTNGILGADLAKLDAQKSNPKKGEELLVVDAADEKYKNKEYPWKGIILPAIGLVLTQGLFGFGAIFAMRANGLFGLYFKKHLKLESMAKEVKYVVKKKLEDETEEETAARKKKEMVTNAIGGVIFIIVMSGVGGYIWYTYIRKPDAGGVPPGGDPAGQVAPVDGAPPAAGMPAGMPAGAPAGMP